MTSLTTVQDRSLLLLIIDLTPTTWGKRYQHRMVSDKMRSQQNKPSLGPAILSDVISAILSFLLAFASCHRDNTIVVIGVAGSDVGVLYPRKDVMDGMIHGSTEDEGGCRVDVNELRESLLLGVGELVQRCVQKSYDVAKSHDTNHVPSENIQVDDQSKLKRYNNGTAIAAATSLALCLINRFMIASGITTNNSSSDTDSLLHRKEDAGILSMISNGGRSGTNNNNTNSAEQRRAQRRARGMLSPRIMILQASEDNTLDYNAFMNCVFCANKNDVVIDGCFIPSGAKDQPDTSTFLEQACDQTGGVYSTPSGRSQISGGLTSVLMTLFLPTLAVRRSLNMTKVTKVDFRARCFETGVSLDIGMVCNLCLSIFKDEPKDGFCHTCGAKVMIQDTTKSSDTRESTSPHSKRIKL